ncbi:hypothetical protein TRICI_006857 [Trichomonascus ciferrii]|uniref:Transcription activator GCR1-like domain-containing protein n=1 Tax=Trichomonascus ciferrii TaxID=44093 RepID=A0A642UC48_9ASCO|nr:hypothetical protein TRICI_006857 [Trichomonascus ciferrii]
MTKEGFPDFSSKEKWYRTTLLVPYLKKAKVDQRTRKLVLGGLPSSLTEGITGITQNRWTGRLSKKYKVSSGKKNHNTSSGAWAGGQAGTSVNDIGGQGHWKLSALNKNCIYDIPHQMLRAQAGFRPDIGTYHIPRADVDPPKDLLDQVFPGVEAMLSEFLLRQWRGKNVGTLRDSQHLVDDLLNAETTNGLHPEDVARVRSAIISEKYKCLRNNAGTIPNRPDTDGCAVGFLKLLLHLRRVLLQDMAILCEKYPDDPLLMHPIFKSESFMTFAVKVRKVHYEPFEQAPISARMAAVMPDVSREFDGLKKSMGAIVQRVNEYRNNQEDTKNELQTMLQDGLSMTRQSMTESFFGLSRQFEKNMQDAINNGLKQLKDQITAEVRRDLMHGLLNGDVIELKRKADGQNGSSSGKKARKVDDEPQEYFKMQRNNDNIFDLWDEWKNRQPCVEYMEQKYGSKWRKNTADTRFYTRRKVIIDAIEDVMRIENKTAEEVLRKADEFQKSLPKPTLHRLAVSISQRKTQSQGLYHPFIHQNL